MRFPTKLNLLSAGLAILACFAVSAASNFSPPTNIVVSGAEVLEQTAGTGNTSTPGADLFPNSNIRYKQVIGARITGQEFPELGWFRRNWQGTMSEAVARFPEAFSGRTGAVLGKSFRWRDCLVDPNQFMTVSEMANPSHPNYIWNQSGRDGLTEALNDPLVRNGTTQIALVVADSATGAVLAVPDFLMDMGLGFIGSSSDRSYVLRMDKSLARDYSVAFFSAILKRWGNDKGLHSVNMSEYFVGDASKFPSDFSLPAHVQGRASMWQRIVDAAPLDENGNRVAIVQTSPLLNSGVTTADLVAAKVGISQPDPDMFQHDCGKGLPADPSCKQGSVSRGLQELFGVVPSFITQDSRYVRMSRKSGEWPSNNDLPNPFGVRQGEKIVAAIEHVMWYRCNVVPTDSTMFKITSESYAEGYWDEDAFFNGLEKFASGGSQSCGSGAFPPRL